MQYLCNVTCLAALLVVGTSIALPLEGNSQIYTYQFIASSAGVPASGVIYTADANFWTDGGTPLSGSYFFVPEVNVSVDLSDGRFSGSDSGAYALTGNISQIGFFMSGGPWGPDGNFQQTWSYVAHYGGGYWQFVGSYAPSINAQPQSLNVSALTAAQFSVNTFGTPPLSYQWEFNGTDILGATNDILTIPNVRQSDLGLYSVVVTNEIGSITSSNATLAMCPFIATPFAGAITYWGKDATLSVGAWGTGPLHYQWYDNGVAILSATNQTFNLRNIQFTNAGLYSVVLSSALGTVTNVPAQVVVNAAGVSLGFSPTLTLNGVAGYSYIIRRSTDLTNTNNWITLTNITLTQPVESWVDSSVDASSPWNNKYFYSVGPQQ